MPHYTSAMGHPRNPTISMNPRLAPRPKQFHLEPSRDNANATRLMVLAAMHPSVAWRAQSDQIFF